MLEASSLQKSMYLYDWEYKSINLNQISNRIGSLYGRYSEEYVNLLKGMLIQNED